MIFGIFVGVLMGIAAFLIFEYLHGGEVVCLCCGETNSLKVEGTHEYGFYLECENCGVQYESSRTSEKCKEDFDGRN